MDDEGHWYQLIDHINDHRNDIISVKCGDEWIVSKNGKRSRKHTTKGWYLEIMWKDGTSSWVPLKEVKENHPIEVAEYASSAGMIHEPEFAWWAPHVLKKRDVIIAKVKSRTKNTSYKYGIRVPTSVREAYDIDKENNNTYWADAIANEMKNIRVAFDILDDGKTC